MKFMNSLLLGLHIIWKFVSHQDQEFKKTEIRKGDYNETHTLFKAPVCNQPS